MHEMKKIRMAVLEPVRRTPVKEKISNGRSNFGCIERTLAGRRNPAPAFGWKNVPPALPDVVKYGEPPFI